VQPVALLTMRVIVLLASFPCFFASTGDPTLIQQGLDVGNNVATVVGTTATTTLIGHAVYIGCYTDGRRRYKNERAWHGRDMKNHQGRGHSRDDCLKKCKNKGFKYAGLAYHDQCNCDNEFGKSQWSNKVPDTECNTRCKYGEGVDVGHPFGVIVWCGGGWRNSVYAIPNEQCSSCWCRGNTGYSGQHWDCLPTPDP
jgi:hypothetical protein